MEKKPKTFYFRSWMINALRSSFRRYPPFYLTRNSVKETYYITSKTGKDIKRVRFTCAQCGIKESNKNTVVDHREPVVNPITGFPLSSDGSDDWTTYIKRLYCPIENLQVLCHICHSKKTGKELKVRRKNYKKKVDKLLT